ncbi:MAG: homoserine kinase [Alphaproteobacteria bacterium]|nr:homoserine kinase [Alphaproteobacteria bacterium]
MAVYTEVTDEEVATFVAAFDIGAVVSLKGIAEGTENTNYLLLTERGNYILTLYEKRVARADLPFFLALMEHLARQGVPCPLPVKARDGQALHELSGRPAVIISFLKGLWPRRIANHHCAEVGRALAGMHLAGQGLALRRENALGLEGWQRLYAGCRERADEVAADLARTIGAELAALAGAWPRALPEGVIHADLFPDNVFFQQERLSGLIDFTFACNDFLAYDIAVCLNAWCFEPAGDFNATKSRVLLREYRRVRPLAAAEVAALPILARGAALRFLLTRLYDWLHQADGALVVRRDPREYLKKLRFHQRVGGAGEYGIE